MSNHKNQLEALRLHSKLMSLCSISYLRNMRLEIMMGSDVFLM